MRRRVPLADNSGWEGIWTSQLDFRIFLLMCMLNWFEIILFKILWFYNLELLQVSMWPRTILVNESGPKPSQGQTVDVQPFLFSFSTLFYSLHFSDFLQSSWTFLFSWQLYLRSVASCPLRHLSCLHDTFPAFTPHSGLYHICSERKSWTSFFFTSGHAIISNQPSGQCPDLVLSAVAGRTGV